MLSKEDYKSYLEQIIQLESKMSAIYKECADRVGDDYIKRVTAALSKAESRHALIVKELVDLFKFSPEA